MDQTFRGISEEQQNDCRAALQAFVERHALSQWGMNVTVQEKVRGTYSVQIEITPPPKLELTRYLDLQEIAVAGPCSMLRQRSIKCWNVRIKPISRKEKYSESASLIFWS